MIQGGKKNSLSTDLVQCVHVLVDFRLEVRSLILMNDIHFSQLINQGSYLWCILGYFFLILARKKAFQGIAHGFGIVPVGFTPFFVLPVSL